MAIIAAKIEVRRGVPDTLARIRSGALADRGGDPRGVLQGIETRSGGPAPVPSWVVRGAVPDS